MRSWIDLRTGFYSFRTALQSCIYTFPLLLQDIERICSLPQAVVACTIAQESILPVRTLTDEDGTVTAHCSYSLLNVITVAPSKREYKILYADFASPLLTCDTFLVPKSKVFRVICYFIFPNELCNSVPFLLLYLRCISFAVRGIIGGELADGERPSAPHVRCGRQH